VKKLLNRLKVTIAPLTPSAAISRFGMMGLLIANSLQAMEQLTTPGQKVSHGTLA